VRRIDPSPPHRCSPPLDGRPEIACRSRRRGAKPWRACRGTRPGSLPALLAPARKSRSSDHDRPGACVRARAEPKEMACRIRRPCRCLKPAWLERHAPGVRSVPARSRTQTRGAPWFQVTAIRAERRCSMSGELAVGETTRRRDPAGACPVENDVVAHGAASACAPPPHRGRRRRPAESRYRPPDDCDARGLREAQLEPVLVGCSGPSVARSDGLAVAGMKSARLPRSARRLR